MLQVLPLFHGKSIHKRMIWGIPISGNPNIAMEWPCNRNRLIGGTYHFLKAYFSGNIPTKYGLIRYSTSILGY
jgi:hypothetical protein